MLAAAAAVAVAFALPAMLRAPAGTPAPDAKPEMMENCPGLVARGMPRAIPGVR